jgi:hypothetical protein
MRTVFAFQCDVLPPAQPVPQCLEALVRDVEAWLQDHPQVAKGLAPGAPGLQREEKSPLQVTWQVSGARRSAVLSWDGPDPADETLQWNLACVLAGVERCVEVNILLSYASQRFQVRPAGAASLALPLVPHLVTRWRCEINGQPVPTHPRLLSAGDVDRFVRNQLASPRRALPVVMVSPEPLFEKPAVDPEPLQQCLLGFAEVVSLADTDAAARLVQCVGTERACPGGAVRVYWPGFDRGVDPLLHPLRTAEQIAQGEPLDQFLLRTFIAAAAERVCPRRLSALAVPEPDVEPPPPAAAPAPAPEPPAADHGEELERLRAENQRLACDAAAARMEAERLTADLERCQAELAAARAGRPVAARPKRKRLAARTEPEYGSILEALTAAGEQFGDVLTIWEDAVLSARRCDSNRASSVFRALQAVADVGRVYFEARRAGRAMGAIDEALSSRIPFKYTARESQTTLSQFGAERIFHHRGRSRLMLRHLTLARGDHKNCVQIYFEFDDETERVDVGYCGKHLPIAGKPT